MVVGSVPGLKLYRVASNRVQCVRRQSIVDSLWWAERILTKSGKLPVAFIVLLQKRKLIAHPFVADGHFQMGIPSKYLHNLAS